MAQSERAILLLGRNGQVGWELERCLAPLAPVVALARADLDLADSDSIRAKIRAVAPSVIVNAAAYTAVDQAESDEAAAMAINGTMPGILAEEAARGRCLLVHYSTDYVFDGTGGGKTTPTPYREGDATNPINAYGRTKLAGEDAVRAVGGDYLILRTSWVYASRGRNFLTTMRRLGGERDELNIVDDQVGSPSWARMIAGATAAIVARLGAGEELGGRAGLYHLTAAGETSWHGFAAAIFDEFAAGAGARRPRTNAISSAEFPTPARRPAYSVLDNTAIAEAFGIVLPNWRTQLGFCLAP